MKTFILIENARFYAYHGVFEQENIVGNTFVVNVKIELNALSACEKDDLEGTVSYADVFGIIEQEMQVRSKLLENIGYRIIKKLKCEFKLIEKIELKISKENPPIGGQVEQASVVLID
ncbi:dihydroneopterin aldolase [Dysgonomonas sp. 520]|uniref:dihydroneopterin aldolase n=1 Tax=Dysgonomonas sp. 520 TaxID=2302931 RepID=UPI0013D82A56|nr:dihydroneopterin aldolase [Dysgonomonas sp. 520]NDW08539.1 dihydroneopterin aldolase [Dysgonomonas sp. 520]